MFEIGLKRSNRPDVASWLKKVFVQQHHLDNVALDKDIEKHRVDGEKELLEESRDSQPEEDLSSTSTTESEDELEEDNFIFYIVLLIVFGVVIIIAVIIGVIVGCKRKPSRKLPLQIKKDLKYSSFVTTDTDTEGESESAGESSAAVTDTDTETLVKK